MFAQARDAEAAAEGYLVDYGWPAVAAEPEAITVNGNGNGNGNGHHNAAGICLTVELVVNGDGHTPVPANCNGNGNGRHEPEPVEGQQSLFSWAEFRADEPAKPNGKKGKSQPAAPSLFQWALDQEREREKGRWPPGARPQRHTGGPPLQCRQPPRKATQPKPQPTHKEKKRWHECLSMTTASFPTLTPK